MEDGSRPPEVFGYSLTFSAIASVWYIRNVLFLRRFGFEYTLDI